MVPGLDPKLHNVPQEKARRGRELPKNKFYTSRLFLPIFLNHSQICSTDLV